VAYTGSVPPFPERQAMKRATYEDVLNAPENKVAEILDGELVLSPRPALRHARASSRLGGHLDGPFDRGRGGPGGWLVLDEPELHLGEHVLVPDLAGWRRERLPSVPDAPWIDLAPDWVCEVLSPSTARIDRGRKLRIYAEAAVSHLWLLDPLEQTLEVLRLRDGAWTIVDVLTGKATVRAVPFDAIELELGELWPDAEAG
jgi:Uma2 family endonuclease